MYKLFTILAVLCLCSCSQKGNSPLAESYDIFVPQTEADNHYNHAAAATFYKGKLYVMWQSSFRDEDAPDTRVLYSISEDKGQSWSEPMDLLSKSELKNNYLQEGEYVTAGGWHCYSDTLVAYINHWKPTLEGNFREGGTEYLLSADGQNWTAPMPILCADGSPLPGVSEPDFRSTPGGRILTAFHVTPGLDCVPYYTDDPRAISGWTRAEIDHIPWPNGGTNKNSSREMEPSWYVAADGRLVMNYRDQASSFRILRSVSSDDGSSWSRPQATEIVDSRSKQCAGNLSDGKAFIVNNPSGSKDRFPLVIRWSTDGYNFPDSLTLRTEYPEMKQQGRYKRLGFSYPKAIVQDDTVYIVYAINKESIAITKVKF